MMADYSPWRSVLQRCRQQFLQLAAEDFAADFLLIHCLNSSGDWRAIKDHVCRSCVDSLRGETIFPRRRGVANGVSISAPDDYSSWGWSLSTAIPSDDIDLDHPLWKPHQAEQAHWRRYWLVASEAANAIASIPEERRASLPPLQGAVSGSSYWLSVIRHAAWEADQTPIFAPKMALPPSPNNKPLPAVPWDQKAWNDAREFFDCEREDWPDVLPDSYFSVVTGLHAKSADLIDWILNGADQVPVEQAAGVAVDAAEPENEQFANSLPSKQARELATYLLSREGERVRWAALPPDAFQSWPATHEAIRKALGRLKQACLNGGFDLEILETEQLVKMYRLAE